MQILGIKFRSSNDIYELDVSGNELVKGDEVVCDTENGINYGAVVVPPHDVKEDDSYKKVLRKATEKDKKELENVKNREKTTLEEAKKIVEKSGLEMKLIDAEYNFDMSKLTISFTADGRIDFRELVRTLASTFRARIELRQIGVRDEAKILGGYGPCGRPICCANHLKDFGKVSIKMSKDQGLSLNPNGISGACGRLLCCLGYEDNDYIKALEKMPRLNSKV